MCNYVCGLLFHVEAAVRKGANEVSCTSRPCEWNVLSYSYFPHEPVELCSVLFKKNQSTKRDRGNLFLYH